MMRALLIGYGKMGQLLAALAPQYNIAISGIVDRGGEYTTASLPETCKTYRLLSQEAIDNCDIVFDFSRAEDILTRILQIATSHKPLVVGTTGWNAHEQEARHIIQQHKSALLAAPNFSLGVALFLHLVEYGSMLFSQFSQYDLSMLEIHHRQKLDAPSGTAKEMAHIAMQHYPHKKLVSGPVANSDEVQLASLRSGHVPGTHEILFDAPEDTVSIIHTARNRDGFAKGALEAAYWLIDKKGWFTLSDMIADKFQMKKKS